MNKYQEAFDYIVCATNRAECVTSQMLVLEELVKKATPKKPNYEGDGYSNGELVYDTWICPNCKERYEVDYDNYKYCPYCGQALDWSEEE